MNSQIDSHQGDTAMQLRDHPLTSYKGVPNWPPVWTWIDGEENKHPKGEVGTLINVTLPSMEPRGRCFLTIEHEGSAYMGALLFNDPAFCLQVSKLLRDYLGCSIQYIGGLDLSHAF